MHRNRDQLRQHVRRRKRIGQAARNIAADAAADAYVAFVGDGDDERFELEVALGRLLVLLDQRNLLEER